MKFIQVPAGFSLELFASEPDIVKPISFTFDERGRLWVIEAINYPNDVRNGEPGDDRIKIVEDTDGDGKADKFTIFADQLNLADEPHVRQRRRRSSSAAPHMLFLKDTDGDGKADVRQILSTGWGIRDTHAGPSNLQYGPDNYIWGSVGYSGFDGEMNGKKLQFTQGTYRFKPDGSGFEYVTMSTNNTWGLGFSENFDVFGSTANNDPSFFVAIPNRFFEGVEGLPPARGSGPGYQSAAQFYTRPLHHAVHPAGGRVRRLHRRRRPLSLHGALVPEGVLEPHRLHHRADRAPRRPGDHRVAGRRLRDARRLEPALGRGGMGRAGARAGRTGRRGLGLRLVQLHRAAQPDADGLRRTAAATPTSSRCGITSRGRIYRVVYKHATPAKKRSAVDDAIAPGCWTRWRPTTCSGACTRSGCSSSAGRRTSCRSWSRWCGTRAVDEVGHQRRRVPRALDAAGPGRDRRTRPSEGYGRRSKR